MVRQARHIGSACLQLLLQNFKRLLLVYLEPVWRVGRGVVHMCLSPCCSTHDVAVRVDGQVVRQQKKAYTPAVISKSFKDVGTYPWNPDRIRELCQMEATGETPDAMSIAAELLVQKMQEHDVELVKRVKSYTARLEEASTLNDWNTQFFSS